MGRGEIWHSQCSISFHLSRQFEPRRRGRDLSPQDGECAAGDGFGFSEVAKAEKRVHMSLNASRASSSEPAHSRRDLELLRGSASSLRPTTPSILAFEPRGARRRRRLRVHALLARQLDSLAKNALPAKDRRERDHRHRRERERQRAQQANARRSHLARDGRGPTDGASSGSALHTTL